MSEPARGTNVPGSAARRPERMQEARGARSATVVAVRWGGAWRSSDSVEAQPARRENASSEVLRPSRIIACLPRRSRSQSNRAELLVEDRHLAVELSAAPDPSELGLASRARPRA